MSVDVTVSRNQSGSVVYEYALLLSLIAIVSLAGITRMGDGVNSSMCKSAMAIAKIDSGEPTFTISVRPTGGGSRTTTPKSGLPSSCIAR